MTVSDLRCTFCGSNKGRQAWPVTDIFDKTRNICICGDCGSWFLWPKPGKAELQQAYDDSYYGESETKFVWKSIENIIDLYRRKRARSMQRLLQPGARVLDIGCGNGRYLMHLSNFGEFDLYGTELPGRSAERASAVNGIKLFTGRFEDSAYTDNYFDSISLYHVFEHLEEPVLALDKITRILKDDGVIVFSFPNIRSIQARLLKGAWLHLDPPRHLFFPDHRRFELLMKERGFKLIKKKYFSPEQNPIGTVQGILNLFYRHRDVLYEYMKGNKSHAPEYGRFNLTMQKLFFLWAMPHCIISDIFECAFNSGATIEMTFRISKSQNSRSNP